MRLEKIRALLDGRLEGDPELDIHGVNGIEGAKEGEISFLAHKKYLTVLKVSQCSAVVVAEGMVTETDKAVIFVKNPHLAFAKLLEQFHPPERETPGISSQAIISEDAVLGKDVTIHPLVFVGKGVQIGDCSIVYPGVYIGENVKIGSRCTIYANVGIYSGTRIGNKVIIHSGVVIGSDGFGYVVGEEGSRYKIPQVGHVAIEDDVEIGANTCIDRATIGETRILKGVKLDNLVQIAHNCIVGEDSVMAAQGGIAGSCKIGKRVMIGGQVGVADHVNVGDDVMIVAQSGVPSNLEGRQIYAGTPTVGRNTWRRTQMALPRLPDLIKRVRSMEKRIEELEKND